MKINGKPYRTIWPTADGNAVRVIDQTKLPHRFEIRRLSTMEEAAHAIRDMIVRGAPLIGATAAYGVALALRDDASDEALDRAHDILLATRPTAVNLRWALKRICDAVRNRPRETRAAAAWRGAAAICDEDVRDLPRGSGRLWGTSMKILREAAATQMARRQRAHPLQCRLARMRRLGRTALAVFYGA